MTPRKTAIALAFLALAAAPAAFAQSYWQQASPATPPEARSNAAMAFDPETGKIVLFGGATRTHVYGDTWTFDGTEWQQLTPSVLPAARTGAVLVYDQAARQLVLFGGSNFFTGFRDTWVWQGARNRWLRMKPKAAPPGAGLGFQDPVTGHAALVYGHDTWEWNGHNWKQLVTNTTPTSHANGAIANDRARGTAVLFGGDITTWTFDGTDWRLENSVQQPDGLGGQAAAWDPDLQEVVAFGGHGTTEALTWVWDGSVWTLLPTTQVPNPREAHAMVLDEARSHILLFGGQDPIGGSFATFFNDTWQLLAAPWPLDPTSSS